jgi:hypothetical protein
MPKLNLLTKILAIAGSVFIWFPILAPLVFAFVSLFSDGKFRFDYLMPAELFPFALLGGCMLYWAALRAKAYQRLIGWGMTSTIIFLIVSQAVAVTTGLASGKVSDNGWQMILVMAIFVFFLISLLATAIGGLTLLRKIFKKPVEPIPSA